MTKLKCFRGTMWVLIWALLLGATPAALPAQDAAIQAPPANSEAPIDLDFNTGEFENFGEEGFVVEEELSPQADAAVGAVKVVVGVLLLLIVLWLIIRVVRGRRNRAV